MRWMVVIYCIITPPVLVLKLYQIAANQIGRNFIIVEISTKFGSYVWIDFYWNFQVLHFSQYHTQTRPLNLGHKHQIFDSTDCLI